MDIPGLRLREHAALLAYQGVLQAIMGGNPTPELLKKETEALRELHAARDALCAALREP